MPWAAAGGAIMPAASRSASHVSLTARSPQGPGPRGRAGCEGRSVMPLTPRLAAVLLQREDEQRASGREIGHLRPERRVEAQDQRPEAAGDGNVLLAVDGVADRPATVPGAGPEVPQLFTTVCIVRPNHAFDIPVDDQPAGGREDAPDRRVLEVDAPLALAGHGIARIQVSVRLTAWRVLRHLIAPEEEPGGGLSHRRLLLDGDLLAHLHGGVVPEARLGAVRAGVPAASAGDPGADEGRLAEAWRAAAHALARLRVDALHPVVHVVHRPHALDLAVGPVIHEHEAALVLVDQQLLAVAVYDQALAEPRVVVPVVVRNLLEVPLEIAVVRIERQDGRRVEVVARARLAPVVVRRRVGRAPVDEVQGRVVGARHPAAAAPELPGVAAPALLIVLDRVELPGLLAVGDVQGPDLALDRQFARGLAQDDLVLDDQRRPREVA